MIDYYEILEVSPNASLEIIRGAYKILFHRYNLEHETEDRSESQKLNNLNLAYEVLSDPDKREVYDAQLQKVKNLHKETTHSLHSGSSDNSPTQSLYEETSKLFQDSLQKTSNKKTQPSVLKRLRWNRWGWSLSILAVLIVLISMVQPDPEKVLQGQLAVKSHIEKRELETSSMKSGIENQKPGANQGDETLDSVNLAK